MTQDSVGCEEYLYRGTLCCLHPCKVQECPEPICAIDFPGGINAYQRYKKMLDILKDGADIQQAADVLGINYYRAKDLFKKGVYLKCPFR